MKTLLNAVLVLSLTACAGLGPALRHPGSPLAWRGYWLAQYQAQLAIGDLGPRQAAGQGRTVLLIPGMTIAGEFFEPMRRRLIRDGFHPVVYEDPDLLTTGVVPAARRLSARVEELAAASGQETIDIVGECVGGVTARYYVEMLGGSRRVTHLVTFLSPHHGSWPAGVAAAVTGWKGLRDIRRQSDLLESVDRAGPAAGVQVTSIYSCSDDLLLPHRTAVVPGAENVELCGKAVDHFDGFWDPQVYQRIVEGLGPRAFPAQLEGQPIVAR